MTAPTEKGDGVVLADLLSWIDAMTAKHGNPNGTDYEQGVNDHGFRIRGKVYAMHEAAMIAATQQATGEAGELIETAQKVARSMGGEFVADPAKIAAFPEATQQAVSPPEDQGSSADADTHRNAADGGSSNEGGE